LKFDVLEDAGGLSAFRPEWSRFLERVPPASPFQSPEWLITWWSHFGSGRLRTLVFREDGEVTGVLPCFLHEWQGRRQLTLLGSGVTDYLDPVLPDRAVASIGDALRKWSDWDVCDWQDLSRETPLAALGTVRDEVPASAVRLSGGFDDFLAARPKDLRRNLRRYREKAEAIGPVTFDVCKSAEALLLDALIDLHRARWERLGESGMIEANRSAGFVRDVAEVFAARGMLRFFTVRFAGQIAAILLALRNESTVFSYLSAFDPQFEAFGFGRELLARAFEYAFANGYQRWDFLRGEEPYKFSWGAEPIARCRVITER
jgi:CelD/BcsL family acetyltransferase involved in cellulose biosynthesis